MEFYYSHILSVILFTPLVGSLVLLFVPRESENGHRIIGNLFALLGLVVSLPLLWRFQIGAAGYQFHETADWIPSIGAHYSLGIDGISYLLIMLTTLLGAIAILSSWSAIKMRTKEYYILLLLLQVGMLGVFMSLDFFLFYLFWEVMLVPMYFLIGVWGSDRRLYAAIKFFLYTLAGSVLMLLAILALYYRAHEVAARRSRSTFPRCSPSSRNSRRTSSKCCSGASSSPLPSRCRCSRSTPGCRTPTPRRPRLVPSSWPAFC